MYLANVCRYIVLNPVRAGIVSSPEQWRWSSYRAMTGLAKMPRFLARDPLLEAVAPDDPADGATRFQQSVLEADADALRLPRHPILGDAAFVERFSPSRAKVRRKGTGRMHAIT